MFGIAAEWTTDSGNWICGVVGVRVSRIGFWRRCGEGAIATERIRLTPGVQKILRRLCLRRRPIVFLTVLIYSHGENFDWFVGSKFIVNVFEEKVVPVEDDVVVDILECVWTEVDVQCGVRNRRG